MYKEVLEKSGLKHGEAVIYDLLLQFGDSSAAEIKKRTIFKRGMVYKFLDDLISKGLVTAHKKAGKTFFRANHPYALMESLDSSIQATKVAQITLQAALPQIVSTFNTMENKPGIRVYEGIEGIKEVYMDTLREKQEIWAILQTSKVEPSLYAWLNTYYAPKRAEANIWAKVIVAEDSKTKGYIEKNTAQKRETRVVPKQKFPVAIEMNIYGSKVAFMNFRENESNIGIIINNKLISETMRALFTLAWEATTTYT